MRRRTLVDRLQQNLDRDDHSGPDWPTVVEDAVLAQDMQWVIEAQRRQEQAGSPERLDARTSSAESSTRTAGTSLTLPQ